MYFTSIGNTPNEEVELKSLFMTIVRLVREIPVKGLTIDPDGMPMVIRYDSMKPGGVMVYGRKQRINFLKLIGTELVHDDVIGCSLAVSQAKNMIKVLEGQLYPVVTKKEYLDRVFKRYNTRHHDLMRFLQENPYTAHNLTILGGELTRSLKRSSSVYDGPNKHNVSRLPK